VPAISREIFPDRRFCGKPPVAASSESHEPSASPDPSRSPQVAAFPDVGGLALLAAAPPRPNHTSSPRRPARAPTGRQPVAAHAGGRDRHDADRRRQHHHVMQPRPPCRWKSCRRSPRPTTSGPGFWTCATSAMSGWRPLELPPNRNSVWIARAGTTNDGGYRFYEGLWQ